jgi:hypothetical protein
MSSSLSTCELCEAARMTTWYHEDEVCWVADCDVCDTPMVVWHRHGAQPSEDELAHMLGALSWIAADRFGDEAFTIDRVMRQIPDHFHAHARDANRWYRRR